MANRSGLALVIVVSELVFAGRVAAQDALSEVVVTARKREQAAFDVPIMLDVIGKDEIEKRGISTVQAIDKLSTSLVFDSVGFGGEDTRPVIRGLPATRGRPAIGILIDGVDVSSHGVYSVGGGQALSQELFDIERIEVVKGPQSALYGRVAFGGAINFVTSKPGDEFEGELLADLGDYGKTKGSLSLGGPVTDSLGVLVKASFSSHNGYYENSTTGSDIGGHESWGLSGVISWLPSDAFSNDLRIAYSDSDTDQHPYVMLTAGNGTAFFQPAPANGLGLTGAFAPNYGELKALAPITLSLDPFDLSELDGGSVDTLFVSNTAEFGITDTVSLTALTGYLDSDSSVDIDGDGVAAPFAFTPFPRPGGTHEALARSRHTRIRTELEQASQELRLGDLSSDGIRWAVGGLYWYEDRYEGDRDITTIFFAPANASANLNNFLLGDVPEDPNYRKTRHWSVYGLLEWDITDDLTASFEGRQSWEDYRYLVTSVALASGTGFGGPIRPAPSQTYTASSDADFFAPRFNLAYDLRENINFYGTVSKGVKPGGYSTFTATSNLTTKEYKPEKVWNFELGTKTRSSDGRVRWNAAVFYMDYTDKQTQSQEPDPNSAFGISLFVKNAGKAEIKGFETDVSFEPIDRLVFAASYTYLDATYTDFKFNSNGALDVTLGGNCTVVIVGGTPLCNVDLSDNQIERTPEHAASVSAAYRMPITAQTELYTQAAVQYQGERQLDAFNRYQIGDFVNVDLQIGLQREAWSIIAYVDNVFDDDSIKSAQENFDIFTFAQAINVNMPDKRQFGVRAKWGF